MQKQYQKLKKRGVLGQTSVEYILLLASLVIIFTSLSVKIRKYYIGDGGVCPNGSFVCRLMDKYSGRGLLDMEGGYRWFRIAYRKK